MARYAIRVGTQALYGPYDDAQSAADDIRKIPHEIQRLGTEVVPLYSISEDVWEPYRG